MAKRTIKKKIPAVALRSMAVLPGMVVHFDLNREFSVKSIEKAMLKDQKLFVVAQKDETIQTPGYADVNEIGCVVIIKQVLKMPGHMLRVLVEGISRAQVFEIAQEEYLLATIKELEDEEEAETDGSDEEMTARVNTLEELVTVYANYHPRMAKVLKKPFEEKISFSRMLDTIAISVPMPHEKRQQILDCVNVNDRFMTLTQILAKEVEVLNIRKDIATQIQKQAEKNQKEYVLRQQLKIIKEELGEGGLDLDEDKFRKEVAKLKASKGVKEEIIKHIDRLGQINDSSSESAVLHGYIETLLKMPWDKVSRDNKDINYAESILNEDHYGLDKVKERILEFLSVRSLTKKGDSPIICLVGPPGTGKTSIAKSVARALDKKYVRICLGGVKDEAEIRGHRRTYVGAMPGRIATALKTAGVKNPLMLLDEIDKMSSDYRGDTASALLEVLDSEQNSKFVDHYIEIPIDLSEVLFIATANSVSDIPRPLLDRMELIEVSGYSANEKFHIAKEHLVRKQLEKNGLKPKSLTIADTALNQVIRGYTKEAGVRGLERNIAQICRKSARMIYQDKKKSVRVTTANLEDFLGSVKYEYDMANEHDEVGIVRGLAVTSVGGDTLQIEVNIMAGKGEIILTGQLGDVMKESACAGMSFIRSIADKYKINAKYFKEHDFHIHIPQGSVPKDGPSAGISMACALFSAIMKKPVRKDVAMTGEITIRGRVLPIGGLKEKTLAAKNANIKTVIVPKKNQKDVEEIDEEIKKGLKIVFVSNMEEVLDIALM